MNLASLLATLYIVTPGRQRKLIRPWIGPFYIAQKLSPPHVKIRRKSDGKLIKNRVHINRLKHGFLWVDKPQDDNPPICVDAIEPCVLWDDEIPPSNIEYSQPGNGQTQNDVQLNHTDNIVNNNVDDEVFEVEKILRTKYINGK